MAFIHGKNAKFWMDGYELSKYFNEYNVAAKAGTAETTVFGIGAKTYIGGLREGQISAKGFFGAATSDVQDLEQTLALGRQQNAALTFCPSGLLGTSAGTRCSVAYAAETDYSITAPVSGVVSTSMTAQADSGLKSGVILYDPTTAAITTGTTTNSPSSSGLNDTGSTDTAFSVGTATSGNYYGSTSGTIALLTTAGNGLLTSTSQVGLVPPSGILMLETSLGQAAFYYTSVTATGFLGLTQITSLAGTATVNSGASGAIPYLSNQGLIANLHLLSFYDTGGSPTALSTAFFNLQESDDGTVWTTIATWGPNGTNTFASSGPGGLTTNTISITAVTPTSTTPTITAAGTWTAGQVVYITGLAASSNIPNGNYTVTTGGTGSFTITLSTATTATGTGSIILLASGATSTPGVGGPFSCSMNPTVTTPGVSITGVTSATTTPTITAAGTWVAGQVVYISGLVYDNIPSNYYSITTGGSGSFVITVPVATGTFSTNGNAYIPPNPVGSTVLIPVGTPIAKNLRIQVITTVGGAATSLYLQFGASVARQ